MCGLFGWLWLVSLTGIARAGDPPSKETEAAEETEDTGDTPDEPLARPSRRRPGQPKPTPSLDDRPAPPEPPLDPAAQLQRVSERQRWRLVEAVGVNEHWWDPYHQNTLKGDRPLVGGWFLRLDGISDTRVVHTPDATSLASLLAVGGSFLHGDTAFQAPDVRLTGLALVDPLAGAVGLRTGFIDLRLRIQSARYDFDGLRIGLQPIKSDHRGLVYRDQQPSVRLYGRRANNRLQYALLAGRRLPVRTDVPTIDPQHLELADTLGMATLTVQDVARPGLDVLGGALWVHGSPAHPRDLAYATLGADGHLGRLNLTGAATLLVGEDSRYGDVLAGEVVLEPSVDLDWMRLRGSFLRASGDARPGDGQARGFDAVREQADLAGSLNSAWVQATLTDPSGLSVGRTQGWLLAPRTDAMDIGLEGPGLQLAGVGVDAVLVPTLRAHIDVNHLQVVEPTPAGRRLGTDLSAGLTWRPWFNDVVSLRAGGGVVRGGPALHPWTGHDHLAVAQSQLLLRY